ncbi:NAD-dependent epimerase/dehydratase family protein [Niallia taxi]|uniref:NAD-dependent epimerase/dehydratase family protein n=1 Tax=Niallia taxi TaxID=2499688 RepID=UPI00317CFABD
MVKVLVTGGASNSMAVKVMEKLTASGMKVVLADNREWDLDTNLNGMASYYKTDLDKRELTSIFTQEKIDIVLHLKHELITSNAMKDSFDQSEVNISTTINVLEACVEAKVKKVIFPSAISVYGNETEEAVEDNFLDPALFEGLSKKMEEKYVMHYHKLYSLPFTILRFADIYGIQTEGFIADNLEKAIDGQAPVIYGDGKQLRNFVYIDDAVDAILASLTKGDNEIINIASQSMYSLQEAAEMIGDSAGNLHPIFKDSQDELASSCSVSVAKAKEILGWKADISLREGLEKAMQQFRLKKHS